MNLAVGSLTQRWLGSCAAAWDGFWFTPRLPHTLSLLRIITGLMLLYSHLVLATDLSSFLGDHAWINNETARQLHDGAFGTSDMGRSYLWYLSNPLVLWVHHALTIVVTAAFAVGLLTRITAPLAYAMQLMYLHRLTGTLFGLDQIVTYSTMYLMISPCGSCYSVDAWLREKMADRRAASRQLQWWFPAAVPSVAANIATRLFQLHLCTIYLFGGLAKARGQSWWDGTAIWYSVGNYEYQSIDMTWLGAYPRVFSAMTHLTLFWEVFYCALVWPKASRPVVLAIAVLVHGGIALFLGMITFGVMMIAANMIFVEPRWVVRLFRREGEQLADSDQQPVDEPSGQRDPLQQQVATATTAAQHSLEERERRVRLDSQRVKDKSKKLSEREEKYRDRVKRLKEREAKIKRLIERRKNKSARKPENDEV